MHSLAWLPKCRARGRRHCDPGNHRRSQVGGSLVGRSRSHRLSHRCHAHRARDRCRPRGNSTQSVQSRPSARTLCSRCRLHESEFEHRRLSRTSFDISSEGLAPATGSRNPPRRERLVRVRTSCRGGSVTGRRCVGTRDRRRRSARGANRNWERLRAFSARRAVYEIDDGTVPKHDRVFHQAKRVSS